MDIQVLKATHEIEYNHVIKTISIVFKTSKAFYNIEFTQYLTKTTLPIINLSKVKCNY